MPEKISAAGYRSGGFAILPASRQLLRETQPVVLEAKVFDLIVLLLERRERALGKHEIVEALWGSRPVSDAALSQLVYKARRALDDEDRTLIRTVYGHGLQWIAAVEVLKVNALLAPPGDGMPGAGDTAAPAEANTPATAPPSGPSPAPAHAPMPFPPRRRIAVRSGIAAMLALALGAVLWFGTARTALRPPQVAVLPVDNATGDAALDWTRLGLAGLITTELQRQDIAGVDPPQVEQLVQQAPAAQRSAVDNVRAGSGAHAVVGGTLSRVGELLRLDLVLDRADVRSEFSASGPSPAQLAVSLAAQLGASLGDRPIAASYPETRDHGPWLSETYARGMDLAARNQWARAMPYFALCLQQDPAFAGARLNLARMQARTDHETEAQENFQYLVAHPSRNPADTIRAHMELAMLVATRGDASSAVSMLEAQRDPAARSGEATLTAWLDMNLANLQSDLGQPQAADAAYARAEAVIREHGLRNYEARLYNVASRMAYARNDLPAARIANQRALESATALGDRRSALGGALNVAVLDINDGQLLQAVPLLLQGWHDARTLQAQDERIHAGVQLAQAVVGLGAAAEVTPLLDTLRPLAAQRQMPFWTATLHALDGVALRAAQQPRLALAQFASVRQTLHGAELDAFLPEVLDEQALAAWELRDTDTLDALAAEARALVARSQTPAQVQLSAQLIEALAAQARHDDVAARTLLEAAEQRAALAHDAATRGKLLAAGLRIALQQGGELAGHWFGGFRAETSQSADALQLYRSWALQRDDTEARQRAESRLDSLRQVALDALARSSADVET